MNSMDLQSLFHTLCDLAAAQTLPRFRSSTEVVNKLDEGFDPVTEGDRAAEQAIRNMLEERVPDHGIIGEEFGSVRKDAAYQWIIDPIDGTRAFISGLPVWGTLIGLYKDGVPFAGVMDQPFTKERFIALPDGDGTLKSHLWRGADEPLRLATRKTETLGQAILMTTSPRIFFEGETARYDRFEQQVKLARYGCDCYAYAMVAAGQVDIVVESGLNAYDIAALIPVIEGAGGVVSNWQGGSAAEGGQVLACSNKAIQQQAIEALRDV